MRPKIPQMEVERLQALHHLRLLDTPHEQCYDRLTRLAASVMKTPYALLNLVDKDRQFMKSAFGMEPFEVSRDLTFCSWTILDSKSLIVPDATRDARFCDNPYVTGDFHVRFYAGVPITSMHGHRLGSLCVVDTKTRRPSERDLALLEDVAFSAQELIRAHEIRRTNFRRFMQTYHDTTMVP